MPEFVYIDVKYQTHIADFHQRYSSEEVIPDNVMLQLLELEGRDILEKYSDEELQKICNGIGPGGIPSFLRRTLNKLHPSLEPAALIHDVEFERSDGSQSAFDASNDRFLANGILASSEYAWYDVRRYVVLNHAHRLAALCRQFGTYSWHLAAERNAAMKSEGEENHGTP